MDLRVVFHPQHPPTPSRVEGVPSTRKKHETVGAGGRSWNTVGSQDPARRSKDYEEA